MHIGICKYPRNPRSGFQRMPHGCLRSEIFSCLGVRSPELQASRHSGRQPWSTCGTRRNFWVKELPLLPTGHFFRQRWSSNRDTDLDPCGIPTTFHPSVYRNTKALLDADSWKQNNQIQSYPWGNWARPTHGVFPIVHPLPSSTPSALRTLTIPDSELCAQWTHRGNPKLLISAFLLWDSNSILLDNDLVLFFLFIR